MRRVVIPVTLLVVLAGCNAFAAGPQRPDETVTPVPVPDVAPAETPTATPHECLAPRPTTPTDGRVETPATPVSLPMDGEVVNGSVLVDEHARRLSNYSYHMHVSPDTDVRAVAGARAFTYEGVGLGLASQWVYAVGGRLYTLRSDANLLVFEEGPYRVGSPTHRRYARILRGETWLGERLGRYNYTVVGTRTWRGTDVRVLRDTLDGGEQLDPDDRAGSLLYVNSTVYVDRRGLIRYVRHAQDVVYNSRRGVHNKTNVSTLTVDEVGTARVRRPDEFCVTDPAAVVTPGGAGRRGPGSGVDADETYPDVGGGDGRRVPGPRRGSDTGTPVDTRTTAKVSTRSIPDAPSGNDTSAGDTAGYNISK